MAHPDETQSPQTIGRDFELELQPDGRYLYKIKTNDHKVYVDPTPAEVALWRSRESMYVIFAKIYKSKTIEEVLSIIEQSKLDKERLK